MRKRGKSILLDFQHFLKPPFEKCDLKKKKSPRPLFFSLVYNGDSDI